MFRNFELFPHAVLAIFFLMIQHITRAFDGKTRVDKTSDMTGKIVIVTGSNTGIGKQTALKLAQRGATVILACRDIKRGMEAANDINTALKATAAADYAFAAQGKGIFMRLDLSDLSNVLDFAARVKELYPEIAVLINNAGLNDEKTLPNGIKAALQVNYLGHYLLVRALYQKVHRVVNLSSVMHHIGNDKYKESGKKGYRGSCYCDSKFYMNLLTHEINRLAKTSKGSNFLKLAVSCNPGAVRSDIWRTVPFQAAFHALMRLLFIEVDEGAATSVEAATADFQEVASHMKESLEKEGSGERGGRMIRHPLIPYLVPYYMPSTRALRFLAFEVMGRFYGPLFSAVTLPFYSAASNEVNAEKESLLGGGGSPASSVSELARGLWVHSAELCIQDLKRSGVESSTFAFLN